MNKNTEGGKTRAESFAESFALGFRIATFSDNAIRQSDGLSIVVVSQVPAVARSLLPDRSTECYRWWSRGENHSRAIPSESSSDHIQEKMKEAALGYTACCRVLNKEECCIYATPFGSCLDDIYDLIKPAIVLKKAQQRPLPQKCMTISFSLTDG